MTDQALLITASGGLLAFILLVWLWWRMSRRNRRAQGPEVGKATMHEATSRRHE